MKDDAAIRPGLAGQRLAVDQEFAPARRLDAQEHAQERRLAAARSADDGDELVVADMQIDILEHHLCVVFLPKPLDGDLRHERGLVLPRERLERSSRSSASMAKASNVIHATYGRITSMAR